MKKLNRKRVVLFAVTAVLILGMIAGVYAAAVQNQDDTQPDNVTSNIQRLWDNISDTLSGQSLSKYDKMIRALERTVDNPVKFNDIVYNFEYLKNVYNLSQEQCDYISELIIDGINADDVIEAAYFWTYTNEDIQIIGEMCALRDRYHNSFWTENAFNRLTNDKCGVLDVDDIEEYFRQGITADDISMANKLCRKGVLTIQEILAMRGEGVSFAEISANINGETVSQQMMTMSASQAQLDNAHESVDDNGDISALNAISPGEVTLAQSLAQINDQPLNVYYQKAIDGVSLKEELEEAEYDMQSKILEDLRGNGIYKDVTDEQIQEYMREEESDNA